AIARRRPVPAQPLHLLAADGGSGKHVRRLVAASVPRAAVHHVHAAARVDDLERRDLGRSRPRPGGAGDEGGRARSRRAPGPAGPRRMNSPSYAAASIARSPNFGRSPRRLLRICGPGRARATRAWTRPSMRLTRAPAWRSSIWTRP